jgi:hypothetical protein
VWLTAFCLPVRSPVVALLAVCARRWKHDPAGDRGGHARGRCAASCDIRAACQQPRCDIRGACQHPRRHLCWFRQHCKLARALTRSLLPSLFQKAGIRPPLATRNVSPRSPSFSHSPISPPFSSSVLLSHSHPLRKHSHSRPPNILKLSLHPHLHAASPMHPLRVGWLNPKVCSACTGARTH